MAITTSPRDAADLATADHPHDRLPTPHDTPAMAVLDTPPCPGPAQTGTADVAATDREAGAVPVVPPTRDDEHRVATNRLALRRLCDEVGQPAVATDMNPTLLADLLDDGRHDARQA